MCLRRSTSPTWRKAYQRMLFHVTQNISDGNRFSSLKAKDILRITTTPVFRPTSVALYQTLSRPRKWVSRENLKNLRPHPAPIGDRPRETIDFIGSNCISGSGKQKSGIEKPRAGIWRRPFFARPSPPPPPRAASRTPARLSAPFRAFSRFSARVVLALRATRKPPANP